MYRYIKLDHSRTVRRSSCFFDRASQLSRLTLVASAQFPVILKPNHLQYGLQNNTDTSPVCFDNFFGNFLSSCGVCKKLRLFQLTARNYSQSFAAAMRAGAKNYLPCLGKRKRIRSERKESNRLEENNFCLRGPSPSNFAINCC